MEEKDRKFCNFLKDITFVIRTYLTKQMPEKEDVMFFFNIENMKKIS